LPTGRRNPETAETIRSRASAGSASIGCSERRVVSTMSSTVSVHTSQRPQTRAPSTAEKWSITNCWRHLVRNCVSLERSQCLFVAADRGGVPRCEPTLCHQVGGPEEHHAAGGVAVATGSPRLLVVRRYAAGCLEVYDESDVGNVDSHPEGRRVLRWRRRPPPSARCEIRDNRIPRPIVHEPLPTSRPTAWASWYHDQHNAARETAARSGHRNRFRELFWQGHDRRIGSRSHLRWRECLARCNVARAGNGWR